MGTRTSSSWRREALRAALVALCIGTLGILAIGPAANAQDAGGDGVLFIDADTVWGPNNIPEDERPAVTCVQSSRFAHNEEVVWRVKVVDPLTGQPMDDTALESVQVVLPDQTLDLHYGGHPRDTPVDFFWTTGWLVPEGYPTGVVDYTINASSLDGRTGTWKQFGVSLAQLTITDEVRPIIEEEEA
jgi:hypothetical protein